MPLNPEDILVSQVSATDFNEDTGEMVSPRVDVLSVDKCDLSWTCYLPGDKLKAAIQYVLGVDYVDNNNVLRRTTPMFHPVHCWAYAKTLHINGIQYDGNDDAAVIWDFQSVPAKWKKYKLDISFDMRKYQILEDDDITTEDQRYCWRRSGNDVQLINQNNGIFKYQATGITNIDNTPCVAPLPITRREGRSVKLTWFSVPVEYIQDGQDSFPLKFTQAIGKTNSASIWGCEAETLLCTKVDDSNRYPSPVITNTVGKPYMLVDVEFEFMYLRQLDSDIGRDSGGTNPITSQRGHNLQLATNGKYYPVQTSGGVKPFPTVSFAKLFTYWSDTF